MRNVRNHLGFILAVAFALAAMVALSQPQFSHRQIWESVASAQSPPDTATPTPTTSSPRITSLTGHTTSSITVNWEEADDTAAHWVYSVKSDGSGGRFLSVPPASPDPGTTPSHATTIMGLDAGTEYWFAVLGNESPSEVSPKEWFSWSGWTKSTTLEIGVVSLGQDTSVAEGGTANLTVTTNVAPTSDLTVSYTIGTDDDDATVDGDSDDYTGSATGSVTIAAGATQGVIPVVINDDSDIDDGTEEILVVKITIPDVPSHRLGERTSATVTIKEGVCDRTSQVRSAILGKLAAISDCAQVTDPDLGGITDNLVLSSQSITELKARDFRGVTNLQNLVLYTNSLTALPEDVFDGLTGLLYLRLYDNDLATLPEDVFDGLTNLQELSLYANSLTALPEDVFDGLTSLRYLWLHDNDLAALPTDVFDGLAGLRYLQLHDNSLTALPKGVFGGLTSLQTLYLETNPGSPFPVTAELEQTGNNQVKVKVAEATPFDMTVTLSAEGGTLSSSTAVVPAGSREGPAITVTPSGGGAVAINITAASFPTSGVETNGAVVYYNGIETNISPVADAGPDQTVSPGATVTLDGSGSSDADGGTLTYAWTQTAGTTVTLSSTTAAGPTFTAPSESGTLTFRLTVTDTHGASATDEVTITLFTPRDMTWSTPGTYTFNVGNANKIVILGKAGDGGGGGGGGGRGGFIGPKSPLTGTLTGGTGGDAGTGNDGPDGTVGTNGSSTSSGNVDAAVQGGSGGGGEAGARGGNSSVTGTGISFTLSGGQGGDGGLGGDTPAYSFGRYLSAKAGGAGGQAVSGHTLGGRSLTALGGAAGSRGNVWSGTPGIWSGFDPAEAGDAGNLGEFSDKRSFDVAAGTVLTIIVGAGGDGGNGGGGGGGGTIMAGSLLTGPDGTSGSSGITGSDGWLRIRTERVNNPFTPQDMTWREPGTYTFNVGSANRVYISGKGGDGGGGGGGGGGQGGRRWPDNSVNYGGNGQRGLAGNAGGSSSVNVDEGITLVGGQGGDGGNGGRGGGRPTAPPEGEEATGGTDATDMAGGEGGDGGSGTDQRGGYISGQDGENGEQGHTGESLSETAFSVAGNTVITIVVGTGGTGGGGGNGGYHPAVVDSNGSGPARGGTGETGSNGDDGWIRIRTEHSTFTLASFDDTGLTMEMLAFIEVGSEAGTGSDNPSALYTASGFMNPDAVPASGTFLEGDLTLGNVSDLTRIIYLDSVGSKNGVLRLNDHPDTKDIGAYFNTGGAGNDLTLYIQTNETNVQSAAVSGMLSGMTRGNNWIDLDTPAAMDSLLSSLSVGDSLIIGFGRPSS